MFVRVEDMTPARFDFLYLLHRDAENNGTSFLCSIRARLGLARQTVWKMAERLIELGIIVKKKVLVSARRRLVAVNLTELGEKRLRQGLGAAFTEEPELPLAAPKPRDEDGNEVDVPKYWRRPQLVDNIIDMILNGEHVTASFWGPGNLPKRVPKRHGREVTNIVNAFFLKRQPATLSALTRRRRRRGEIGRVLTFMHQLAAALGNSARSIYKLPWEKDAWC
jgi:DNA-binding MarR family transcriptional regulator